MNRRLLRVIGCLAVTFGCLQAEDEEDRGRGVARLSVIAGDVSIRRGDSGDWIAAAVNAPLVVQDRLLTGLNSRAEVQFDYANMMRLSGNAEVRLSELGNGRYQIEVISGTVIFRILRDTKAEVDVNTPAASVRPLKKGVYRVAVLADGTAEITVRSGETEIYTPRGTERLNSGKSMRVRSAASTPEFQVISEVPPDEFDRWSESRDRDLERAGSYRYVSPDVYGAEDLDGHGRWVSVGSYGMVWSPYVAAGWAPYRHGRWAWVDWYGWSWLSYDPWGWAPYHYGRWFYNQPYGWCWWPGGYGRHYWQPGLVAFFGFGGGYGGFSFGFGASWGNVGWVPLAPYEPYHRWYGHGYYGGYKNRTYVNNSVNIVNNVNIYNSYRNARVQNGVTGLGADDFRAGRAGRAARIDGSSLRTASLSQGQVPLAPGRESLRLSDREARVVSSAREDGRFFSRRAATAVDRVPFEQQRSSLEELSRRTFGDARRDQGREVSRGEAAASPSSTGQARSADERGWRRVGETRQGRDRVSIDRPTSMVEDGAGSGWRRLGGTTRSQQAPSLSPEAGRTSGESAERGWRRFGDPGAGDTSRSGGRLEGESAGRLTESPTRTRSDDTWRRLGSGSQQEASGTRQERETGAGRLFRSEQSERRSESNFGGRREGRSDSGGERIQVSPPMVRERSQPDSGRFGGGSMRSGDSGVRGGGGSMRSGGDGGSRSMGGSMRGGGSGGGGGSRSGASGGGGGRSGGGGRGR